MLTDTGKLSQRTSNAIKLTDMKMKDTDVDKSDFTPVCTTAFAPRILNWHLQLELSLLSDSKNNLTFILYPATAGRNFDDRILVCDSLQLSLPRKLLLFNIQFQIPQHTFPK
uniref:Uncharacterized protein n=1 Tax=Strongyloides venezuelensis TaxID=75913 RepID=A0A0K0FZX7_STRVS